VAEDFEGVFPGAWLLYDNRPGNGEYYWAKRDCRHAPGAGLYSAWAVGGGTDGAPLACRSPYPNYADSWMVYGPFSLTGATGAEVRFQAWVDVYYRQWDYLCVLASTDGAHFDGSCSNDTFDAWIEYVLDLSAVGALGNLLGQEHVWVAFRFYSAMSNTSRDGAYVDNIVVRKCIEGFCGIETD
jgi:hypothetical protein